MTSVAASLPRSHPADLVLRVLTLAALAVSCYVHVDLAPLYRGVGDSLTQAQLFYVQASVAGLVGLWVLATGMRTAWWAAALVGAASFGAVMLYRYVDVGAIGPLPNMTDMSWQPSPEKLLSAVAEAAVIVLCALRGALARRARPGRPADGS